VLLVVLWRLRYKLRLRDLAAMFLARKPRHGLPYTCLHLEMAENWW